MILVKEMFGYLSIKPQIDIHLVLHVTAWNKNKEKPSFLYLNI